MCRLLTASRGNYATLQRFMSENIGTTSASRWILPLLGVLTDKDLRDVSSDVLQDHLLHTPSCPKDMPDDIYARYVLNPRVDNEMLTPYKAFFVQVLSKEKRLIIRVIPTSGLCGVVKMWQLTAFGILKLFACIPKVCGNCVKPMSIHVKYSLSA